MYFDDVLVMIRSKSVVPNRMLKIFRKDSRKGYIYLKNDEFVLEDKEGNVNTYQFKTEDLLANDWSYILVATV